MALRTFSLVISFKMQPIFIGLFLVALVGVVYAAPPGKYSDKYDHINVESILSNDRVLTTYINCMLDKGPCTAEGREFRKNLPDALKTSCSKCTDGQKKLIKKSSAYIIQNRKNDWDQIRKKYDPNGDHSVSFKKFLAEP